MSEYMSLLLLIGMGVLLVSLIYTWNIARTRKNLRGVTDSKIHEEVEEHPYLRNPIFLTYIIMFVLVILIIVYYATNYNW